MYRTALIALAFSLALAACVSGSTQTAPRLVFEPATFICDPPVSPGAQPRPIPPGKSLEDVCPPGARAYLVYDDAPSFSHIPPPLFLNTASPHETQPDPGRKTTP
jgi:hypothetical protein